MPVGSKELIAVPVRTDPMVAIPPATERDIPESVTPAYVAERRLILEYQKVPHQQLSRAWLRAGGIEPRPTMEFDGIEAIMTLRSEDGAE